MLNSAPEVPWADSWRKYETGVEILGHGGGRYGVNKRGEKIENRIQWSPGALDQSEMIRALPGVGF